MNELASRLLPLGAAGLDVVEHDFVGPATWTSMTDVPAMYMPATEGLCHLVFAMSLKGCDPQWPVYFTADNLTNLARAAPLFTLTIISKSQDIWWLAVPVTEGVKAKADLIRAVRVTRDRPLEFTVVATAAGHFEAALHYFPMSIDRADRVVVAAEKAIAEFMRGG